jgi:MerR family transcriptional regulator/heat shock protein HspR
MTKRSWDQRLEDPTEPLYSIAVVADLLNIDAQAVRRYETAGIASVERNDGNQRRFSRNDIAALAHAVGMANEGISVNAVARIVELERQLAELRDPAPPLPDEPGQSKRRT